MGVPRTLAVELPFGHILGQPNDKAGQTRVIQQAMKVLEDAVRPVTIVHSPEKWSGTLDEAIHISHPEAQSPIAAQMGRHIGQFLRGLRRGKRP